MPQRILARTIIMTAIAACAIAFTAPVESAASSPAVGKEAPGFVLESTSGKPLSLDALRRRVVVLNFFATWCPPCRAETPDLVAIERAYRKRGVTFLGVDDRENAELVRVFARANRVAFPLVLDSAGAIEDQYDVRAIPTTYVLDPSGVIRYRNVQQLDAKTLERVLDAVIADRPIKTTPTQTLFDAIAARATATIGRSLEAANRDAVLGRSSRVANETTSAITLGTKAASRLSDLQNGDDQADLDSYAATEAGDRLALALAQAYELRSRFDTKPGAVRTDLEQAALQRGQVYEDGEQFAAAERVYAEAVSLEPTDTAGYDGEYLAAYEQRNYDGAEAVALAEAQIAPADPENWLTLASAYNQLKKFDLAAKMERHALVLAEADLERHPHKKHAAYEVGRVWLKTARTEILAGKPASAIQLLRRSAQAAPRTIVQQQADEQRVALEPALPDITIAGNLSTTAAAASPGELFISVRNTSTLRRDVRLAAANVPAKWVLSFCYAKVCDPYRSTISLDAGKSLRVELKVVPLTPTGGPWRMELSSSDPQNVIVGVAAKTSRARIDVTGS